MFKFFKKKGHFDENIYSPIKGSCIRLEDVPDEVFSSKMMGEGIGFKLKESIIYSPLDGTVTLLAKTNHAIGIKGDNNVEVLIHIGLDTVNLKGNGFTLRVEQGERIKKGQPLIEVDFNIMKENNIDLTTPMVITNGDDTGEVDIIGKGEVEVGDVIIQIK